jgi:hypothetical protein
MSFQLNQWYIGDVSGDIAESIVFVPVGQLQNGAHRAVFYELWQRKAKLGSTRGLNLLRLRDFSPDEIGALGQRELDKCVARVEARLAEGRRA